MKFSDKQGRDWLIEINIGQISRVRNLVKVDLYNLFGDEAKRLFSDPVLLVDTLYVICRDQCKERQISDADFGGLFEGDVLEAAANALLEAVLNFFPTSRQKILRATLTKSNELAEQMQAKALEQIARLSATDLLTRTA
jgi:hypothetical protein